MNIRLLDTPDLVSYRELRLRALREEPTAFITSPADEEHLPLSEFASRLRPFGSADNGIFGAIAEDGQIAGMLGFARDCKLKRGHIAHLWSMYVVPEFRGRGIGAALLDAAIEHARRIAGIRQLHLGVTLGNEVATALYRARGFEVFGLESGALCVDGTYYDEEHMVLRLDERETR